MLPSILDVLPHLEGHTDFLDPFINYPNDTIRSGVDIVIGVPTVTRKGVGRILLMFFEIFSRRFGLGVIFERCIALNCFEKKKPKTVCFAHEKTLLLEGKETHCDSGDFSNFWNHYF